MGFDEGTDPKRKPLGQNTYGELRSRFVAGQQAFDRWREERRERAAEKRAAKQAAMMRDQHAHSRFWLLNVPALATICAAIVEWYWAVLFCIEATGQLGMDWSTSVGSDVAAAGAWHFLFDIQNLWVLIGLVLATMPIVMLSMIWLPVQFAMRGAGRWRRGTLIAVGLLANVLVIVSGTVVMNYNRQDQVREGLVIEQTAQQGRAAIDARLAFEQEQLRLALANANPYLNQAANVGAAEWERSYVAQARASNDPRLPMLERALGAARAADARRANIERLTIERAQAAPEAASAAVVEDNVGAELNTFAQYVEVWRPPFVAFICTLIGIFGAWWTLAMLERLNPKDVLRSGWADDAHRIEDLRDQEPIVPETDPKGRVKMKPPRRKFTEADTGEEIEQTLVPAHYRTIKRGARTTMEIKPDIPPDETGVDVDGGNRIGTANTIGGAFDPGSLEHKAFDAKPTKNPAAHSVMSVDQDLAQPNGNANTTDAGVDVPVDVATTESAITQPEPPSEEIDYEALALADEPAEADEPDHVELPDNEGVMLEPDQPEEEQHDAHVKARGLIAAE